MKKWRGKFFHFQKNFFSWNWWYQAKSWFMQISKMSGLSRFRHHSSRKCSVQVCCWRENASTRHRQLRGCFIGWHNKTCQSIITSHTLHDTTTINYHTWIVCMFASCFHHVSITWKNVHPSKTFRMQQKKRNVCGEKKLLPIDVLYSEGIRRQ